MFFFARVREEKPVYDTTAPFQDVWITRRFVALADDIGRPELELGREGCGTGPLNILIIVIGALILASHHIDLVEALAVAADTFQLEMCVSEIQMR